MQSGSSRPQPQSQPSSLSYHSGGQSHPEGQTGWHPDAVTSATQVASQVVLQQSGIREQTQSVVGFQLSVQPGAAWASQQPQSAPQPSV
jgi:hypothetical protein